MAEATKDELAAKRGEASTNGSSNGKAAKDEAKRAKAEADAKAAEAAELASKKEALGDDAGDPESIAERAANGDGAEEEDGQFVFEVEEQGRKVTLGTLIKRGTPVEFFTKLGGKRFTGAQAMSLIAFDDPERTLIVPIRAGKVEADPTYNADGTVKKVAVTMNLKPVTAYDSRSEAARVALRGE